MKNNVVGRRFRGIASTSQAGIERMQHPVTDKVAFSFGTIIAVYPDRMTCDVETSNGMLQKNIPILTQCGVIDGEIWGTLDLPSVDTTVVIGFIEGRESYPFILGTFLPYAANIFQTDQVPVASANKATVLSLLENIHENIYRKIFKSGTTIEVKDDGTIQVETPSGTLLEIQETASGKLNVVATGDIHLEDAGGNVIEMTGSSVVINSNLEVLQ